MRGADSHLSRKNSGEGGTRACSKIVDSYNRRQDQLRSKKGKTNWPILAKKDG